MKYTRWFGPDEKPVRVGVYQTKFTLNGYIKNGFSWWHGTRWGNQYDDIFSATVNRYFVLEDAVQRKIWRGLTTKDGK